MSDLFDTAARKQPANLTVNSDLLRWPPPGTARPR
jgi:hypothetical protein